MITNSKITSMIGECRKNPYLRVGIASDSYRDIVKSTLALLGDEPLLIKPHMIILQNGSSMTFFKGDCSVVSTGRVFDTIVLDTDITSPTIIQCLDKLLVKGG